MCHEVCGELMRVSFRVCVCVCVCVCVVWGSFPARVRGEAAWVPMGMAGSGVGWGAVSPPSRDLPLPGPIRAVKPFLHPWDSDPEKRKGPLRALSQQRGQSRGGRRRPGASWRGWEAVRRETQAPGGEGGARQALSCSGSRGRARAGSPSGGMGPGGPPGGQRLVVACTCSRSPSPCLLLQARDRKMVGDITGAQSYASTAKCLNIWALVLGIFLTIGAVALLVFACIAVYEMALQHAKSNRGY